MYRVVLVLDEREIPLADFDDRDDADDFLDLLSPDVTAMYSWYEPEVPE